MPRIVPDGVFDAWSWCASDTIEWRRPTKDLKIGDAIDARNPPGLAFVMKRPEAVSFLPRELAQLHVTGYGLDDTVWSLAPWAIDDATDLLYEHRAKPADVFWLAATSLEALVWGLHDWVHFHNHGPFDEPAMTELQCDLVALSWLRLNREAIGLDDAMIETIARQLGALTEKRFKEEGLALPPSSLFRGSYPEVVSFG